MQCILFSYLFLEVRLCVVLVSNQCFTGRKKRSECSQFGESRAFLTGELKDESYSEKCYQRSKFHPEQLNPQKWNSSWSYIVDVYSVSQPVTHSQFISFCHYTFWTAECPRRMVQVATLCSNLDPVCVTLRCKSVKINNVVFTQTTVKRFDSGPMQISPRRDDSVWGLTVSLAQKNGWALGVH